jgi:hypothetical protein
VWEASWKLKAEDPISKQELNVSRPAMGHGYGVQKPTRHRCKPAGSVIMDKALPQGGGGCGSNQHASCSRHTFWWNGRVPLMRCR